MENKLEKLRSGMAVNIIGAIILLLTVFAVIVSTIGFISFTNAFKREYAVSTYHMADTATTLINGDHLEDYLNGEEEEEYAATKRLLDTYCKRMSVSLIYVIIVDRSDYGRFTSVFNPVDNTVDNSQYTEWELGYQRNTTNDEYRRKYQAIYEGEALYETVYRTNPVDGQHPHITTLVPVKDSKSKVVAILCMQRPIRELHEARRPYLINIGLSTLFLAVFAAAFSAVYIRKQFVSPLQKVSDEATRFAKENTKGEPLRSISKYRELSNLAGSIDTMETDMVNYIENLTAVTAEKERIGAELSFASTIQENSIPNSFPAFPDRKEFDIYASMTPAKEVGGDFYNFFLIDDDHLAMVIGDVSGKGVPAALFMMVTNIVLSNRTLMGGTPAEILSFLNTNICEHNSENMFVTLWLGILEISTGKIVAANAGHEDAVICRKQEEFEFFKTKHGIAVGAIQSAQYRDFEIQMEKGDKLFLYTDGVPEATDKDNQMFSDQRMLSSLNANRNGTPEEILNEVHRCVNEFVGEAPQFDDLTMLCFELKSEEPDQSAVSG